MPYNISIWNQFECSLRIPLTSLHTLFNEMNAEFNGDEDEDESDGHEYIYHRPIIDGKNVHMYLAGEWEQAFIGKLEGDMVVVEDMNIRSEWSGTCFEFMTEHMFKDSTGVYRAVLIWEDGNTIHLFEVRDGVVSVTDLDIVKLITENESYKKLFNRG